jgi:hypothetical protein
MVEVLEGKLPAGMPTLFASMMKRVHRVGMDIKVASVAHDLRDYYASRKAEFGGKMLASPDAIHLAMAIIYRVTEFHTFDNDGDAKTLVLLPLSGNVGGNRLTICKPTARNPGLDLRPGGSKTTPSNPSAS